MTQEALKMALPLLEDCVNSYRLKYERPAFDKAIAAIKEALAQPEQWGASAITHPEYVAEQKRKTEELRSMLTQPEQEPPKYSFKAHWEKDGRIGIAGAVVRPDGGVHVLQVTIDPPQPEQEPYGIALTNIPHPQGVSAPDDLNADALEVVELELPDECEAVGWADDGVINWIAGKQFKHASFLYPTQQQRTFVGLTGEEAMDVTRKEGHELLDFIYEYGTGVEGVEERIVAICKAIESKLKELNT